MNNLQICFALSFSGSSNSQDSFPAPGSSGTSMDGYGYGYPPGSTPDYSSPPMQRPTSQTNAPSPHPGELFSIFCILQQQRRKEFSNMELHIPYIKNRELHSTLNKQ